MREKGGGEGGIKTKTVEILDGAILQIKICSFLLWRAREAGWTNAAGGAISRCVPSHRTRCGRLKRTYRDQYRQEYTMVGNMRQTAFH